MPELPEPVTVQAGEAPPELPELPPGYVWHMSVTAEADVIHPDGSKN